MSSMGEENPKLEINHSWIAKERDIWTTVNGKENQFIQVKGREIEGCLRSPNIYGNGLFELFISKVLSPEALEDGSNSS